MIVRQRIEANGNFGREFSLHLELGYVVIQLVSQALSHNRSSAVVDGEVRVSLPNLLPHAPKDRGVDQHHAGEVEEKRRLEFRGLHCEELQIPRSAWDDKLFKLTSLTKARRFYTAECPPRYYLRTGDGAP